MSKCYQDHTANTAISAVDRELKMMRKKAEHIKTLRQNGKLTATEVAKARKDFIGIYRNLLQDALAD